MVLKTTPRKFYRYYLEVLRTTHPLTSLTTRDLDILSQLCYYNNKYAEFPFPERTQLIFHANTKKEIQNYLGISMYVMNNTISKLRKLNILNEKDEIIKPLQISHEKNTTITFNFKVEEAVEVFTPEKETTDELQD